MSTADKLTTIAENVPKVYESGQENIKAQVEPVNAELEKCLAGEAVEGKTWYDKFWDAFQNNGNRKSYRYAFGSCFTPDNFKPKYPIIPKAGYNGDGAANFLFAYTNRDFENRKKIDLSNVPIDLSHYNDNFEGAILDNVFANAYVDNVYINLTNIKKVNRLFTSADGEPSKGVSNVTLTVTESLTQIASPFYYFPNVVFNVNFTEGSVWAAPFDVRTINKLTHDSIVNIINVLSKSTAGLTATFSKEAVTNAFGGVDSAEWTALIATKSNWTISLV